MRTIILALLLLLPITAEAAFRVYLVPTVTDAQGYRTPKYFDTLATKTKWGAIYYGIEGWVLVGANLTDADETSVVSQPDAFAIPSAMNATLTAGNVTTVQTRLEAINMPAQWVTTSLTWRQVLRGSIGLSLILQRFQTKQVSRFFSTTSMDATISSLTAGQRNNLTDAATDLGLDTSGITGATTIRQALRILAQQLTRDFELNGQLIR